MCYLMDHLLSKKEIAHGCMEYAEVQRLSREIERHASTCHECHGTTETTDEVLSKLFNGAIVNDRTNNH